jgi:hypothetical protein
LDGRRRLGEDGNVNRTGRASRALFPALLTAAILAVLVLFCPTSAVKGAAAAGSDTEMGAATPITLDADAARWGALRQPRSLVEQATGLDRLPFAAFGVALLAAIALFLLASRPRLHGWVPRWLAARLPGVRAPPAPAF